MKGETTSFRSSHVNGDLVVIHQRTDSWGRNEPLGGGFMGYPSSPGEAATGTTSRRTRRTLAALAGCSALLLAGCGASSPTKAQYTANANAICRTTGTQTAQIGRAHV